jgi:hypothetical protein
MTRFALCTAAAALLLLASTASAHICLLYPIMRGPHPDLYPGDPVCYQRAPSCGAYMPKGAPTATYIANKPQTVTFMQNLNHFWQPNPGHYDLAVSYDAEKTWVMLGKSVPDFPAQNMNTQTTFDVPVTFPTPSESAVVRARYVSHNPDEVVPKNNTDAIFYSCADVKILKAGNYGKGSFQKAVQQAVKAAETDAPKAAGKGCQTPPRFVAQGEETDFAGAVTMEHKIHYDTVYGMVKWERSNVKFGGEYSMTDYWNLTDAGGYTPQYIVGLDGPETCSLYGGDKFFPWAYGAGVGQELIGEQLVGDFTVREYAIAAAGMQFAAKIPKGAGYCLPVKFRQTGKQDINWSISNAVDKIDPAVFVVPAMCFQHRPDRGCWAHRRNKKTQG